MGGLRLCWIDKTGIFACFKINTLFFNARSDNGKLRHQKSNPIFPDKCYFVLIAFIVDYGSFVVSVES